MSRILMTGATGQLGSALGGPLQDLGEVVGLANTSRRQGVRLVDLTDAGETREALEAIRPDTIVHLAALTDVDLCEKAPEKAYRLNVRATQNLVEWCRDQAPDTRILYVSTDQIYDAPGPSGEEQVRPKNVYALTKLWAEDHARRLAQHCVLRVNFFSGDAGRDKGLVSWLTASAKAAKPARLFVDVLFNPLHVDDLATSMIEMMRHDAVGTFNLGAGGEGLSKAAFLRAAARRLGLSDATFEDGSVADAQLAAYRPRDMRMDVSRAEAFLRHRMPTIETGLARLALEVKRS